VSNNSIPVLRNILTASVFGQKNLRRTGAVLVSVSKTDCECSVIAFEMGVLLHYSGIEARSVVTREPCVRLVVTTAFLCGNPATRHTVIIPGTGLPTSFNLMQIFLQPGTFYSNVGMLQFVSVFEHKRCDRHVESRLIFGLTLVLTP
jgi:hypothetical protein